MIKSKARIYSVHSTVRDVIPALSLAMAILLCVSFIGFIVVASHHGTLPYTGTVQIAFSASLISFVLIGVYWKDFWTWVIQGKADKLAQRFDYFEIDEDELEDLRHYTSEYTGHFVEFRGIHSDISPPPGRVFVHFDNEQDRILFRLTNR